MKPSKATYDVQNEVCSRHLNLMLHQMRTTPHVVIGKIFAHILTCFNKKFHDMKKNGKYYFDNAAYVHFTFLGKVLIDGYVNTAIFTQKKQKLRPFL